MFFGDAANHICFAAQRMLPHRCQYLIGILFGNERDQLAFIGDQRYGGLTIRPYSKSLA